MNTKGRLIVFGDSDFATDGLNQSIPGLSDILLNAIDWSTKQEKLINLTPKNNVLRTYQPPSTIELILSILTALCIIPLVIIFAGVWAWFARRRRG